MSGTDRPQMIFEALIEPNARKKIVQRWLGPPFTPESFHYYGLPNIFIVDKMMLNYEIVARGVLPEHLFELAAKISTVEWATILVLQVRSFSSEPCSFRAILSGNSVE